ncbi:uncharacterized protein LOC131874232 [Cryptomeria japonica]|uniref:uncharacterized protein LOC131874232 n=1 Tax=Cryptomeria japonica TaxID=3369 RepID=UPI0027DA1C87|nr:uncharacterized protein LOC131874232 [Cryptomeria japonica]
MDASLEGLGAVLVQDGRVIACESRKLKNHEQNYSTHALELAAVVHALVRWRHFLLGHRFKLYSDHRNLQYIFMQPNLNARQRCWIEFSCEDEFEEIIAEVTAGRALEGRYAGYSVELDGLLRHFGCIYVPLSDGLRDFIVSEAHHAPYWAHPDRLTKVVHFSPIRSLYIATTVARVFLEGVVRLHGIPRRIISDHDPVFTSAFWIAL